MKNSILKSADLKVESLVTSLNEKERRTKDGKLTLGKIKFLVSILENKRILINFFKGRIE